MKFKKGVLSHDKNWTESDISNYRYFVGADFVDQLQSAFDSLGLSQRNFAQKLNLSEGRVSQVFNDPGNLTLDTMIKYSRAAGLKAGIVLYNDNDTENKRGPISGSIFVECWKRNGKPYQMLEDSQSAHIANWGLEKALLKPLLKSETVGESLTVPAKDSFHLKPQVYRNSLQGQYLNYADESNSYQTLS